MMSAAGARRVTLAERHTHYITGIDRSSEIGE
jgi:hypothetical protein